MFIKTVRKHRLKTKQQKHEKQRTDMNRKITLIAGTLLIAGIIPTYAATRAKTKSTDSKAASKPAAESVESSKKDSKKESAKAPTATAAEKKIAADLTTTQKSKLLTMLNDGTAKELVSIDGIAKVRSAAIVEARPFKKIEEIALVKGIGKVTFTKIVSHGKSLTQRKSSTSKKS